MFPRFLDTSVAGNLITSNKRRVPDTDWNNRVLICLPIDDGVSVVL